MGLAKDKPQSEQRTRCKVPLLRLGTWRTERQPGQGRQSGAVAPVALVGSAALKSGMAGIEAKRESRREPIQSRRPARAAGHCPPPVDSILAGETESFTPRV